MRAKDLIKFAWRALTNRKLRATLTIIGIVIGPATIVALLSVTTGFGNAVTGELARTGATSIFVIPTKGAYLTTSDVNTVGGMGGVSAVIPYWLLTGTITQGTQTTSVQVMAVDFSDLGSFLPGLSLATGSEPSSYDLTSADVGWSVSHPSIVGTSSVGLNQVIKVSFQSGESRSFSVSGIFNQFGQGFYVNPDTTIFVPLSEGQALLHTDDYSGMVVVASSNSVVTQVTNELTIQYGQTMRIVSVTSLVSSIQSVIDSLGTILGTVGGISVLVALIGIMTTMFTTVVERTKEIGILKAVGYKRSNIMSLFLVESILTGFLGGIIGAGVGTALSFTLGSVFAGLGKARLGAGTGKAASALNISSLHVTPVITPELLLFAIGLATAVGALARLLPAWRASKLLPVEALYSQ
jgi:putative ABC transport system permease protein